MSCFFFYFSRYQTKCVIRFLLRQLMLSYIGRFIMHQPLKQCPTWRKEGKMKGQKFEYLEKWNNFLDEIKSIFHKYLSITIWWKKWKTMDTSFNLEYCKFLSLTPSISSLLFLLLSVKVALHFSKKYFLMQLRS